MRSFGFHATANFTDNHNGVRFGVVHQKFDGFFGRCADDGVATDADCRRDAHARLHDLVRRLIRERSRLRNNANPSFFEHKTRHNAHFRFVGRNNSGTVWTNQTAIFIRNIRLYFQHILQRNPLSNANNDLDSRFRRFHNGISRKAWRDKNDTRIRSCLVHGIFYGVENGAVEVS